MKTPLLLSIFLSAGAFAQADSKGTAKVHDSHSTIYTKKVIRVVNALDVGRFETQEKYLEMLQTACKRNHCTSLEKQTIKSVGQQILNCQIKHLKSHNIENPDATNICESKQAIFGCDSLATPLLRRMCYSGNRYSLKTLQIKEKRIKSRKPASK